MSEQEPPLDQNHAISDRVNAIGTKTCASCGAAIDENEWFPIRGRPDEDGEFQLYSFCDNGCVEAWDGPGE